MPTFLNANNILGLSKKTIFSWPINSSSCRKKNFYNIVLKNYIAILIIAITIDIFFAVAAVLLLVVVL